MKLVKVGRSTCSKCKYSEILRGQYVCNYISDTNHSRLFNKDGTKKHDASLCSTFEEKKGDVDRRRAFNNKEDLWTIV